MSKDDLDGKAEVGQLARENGHDYTFNAAAGALRQGTGGSWARDHAFEERRYRAMYGKNRHGLRQIGQGGRLVMGFLHNTDPDIAFDQIQQLIANAKRRGELS